MDPPVIAGVTLTPLRHIPGDAGAVRHALKKSAPGFAGFGEAYFSEIHQGAIKSWRRHIRVVMNLVVPRGQVRFILHHPDDAVFDDISIGERNYARLTVPAGIWVAFQGQGPGSSLILDVIDEEHDPAEAETRELAAFDFPW